MTGRRTRSRTFEVLRRRGRVSEPDAERGDRQLDAEGLCDCDRDGAGAARRNAVEPRVGDEQRGRRDRRAVEPGCAPEYCEPGQAEAERKPGIEARPGDPSVP